MTFRRLPAEDTVSEEPRDVVSERLQQLAGEDVERILERAIALQMDSADAPRGSMDAAALGRIADELGIDRRHLRAAMAEELVRIQKEEPGWLARNLMPDRIAESRIVTASPDRVRAVLDYWLGRHEGLRKYSDSVEGSRWHRDGSPITAIRHVFNMAQGDGSLRSARSVNDTIRPFTVGTQVVSIEADTSNLRRLAVGLLIGSGILAGAAAGIAAGADPGGPGLNSVAAGVGVAALAGGGFWLGFRMWADKLRRGVGRVADAVAHPHLIQAEESVPKRLSRFIQQLRMIGDDSRR